MKKIILAVMLIFISAAAVVSAANDEIVIENPPKMTVGDSFTYQGFKSLDDAKAGANPKWIANNTIIEVKDDGGYVKSAGNRISVYDKNGNLISRQRGDQNTTYKPFWPKFKYPIKVGDKYKVNFSHNRPDGYDNDFTAVVRVVGWETVTVPAGTFKAFVGFDEIRNNW